jgi:hypothetical protein
MSRLAKLVALSLAIAHGSAPHGSAPHGLRHSKDLGSKGKEYFKEMNRQLAESKKINTNSEIRKAINVLKRIRQKHNTKSRSKSNRRTRRS